MRVLRKIFSKIFNNSSNSSHVLKDPLFDPRPQNTPLPRQFKTPAASPAAPGPHATRSLSAHDRRRARSQDDGVDFEIDSDTVAVVIDLTRDVVDRTIRRTSLWDTTPSLDTHTPAPAPEPFRSGGGGDYNGGGASSSWGSDSSGGDSGGGGGGGGSEIRKLTAMMQSVSGKRSGRDRILELA